MAALPPLKLPRGFSQQYILGNGEAFHQLEILVNHPDAAPHGFARAEKPAWHARDLDRTGIRRIEAGDVHQRRFAGTVFTQQCVNLTEVHAQVRGGKRQKIAEGFSDPAELERRRHGQQEV